MIRQGRVSVDGEPARIGQKVDPDHATVEVDGVPLPVRPGLVYYLVYKPPGVISTADDPHGRSTVVGLVPDDVRVYPVGRLDADSEGLILLTNDGDLTNLVTHPRFGVEKTYVALVEGAPDRGALGRLLEGVRLGDGVGRAVSARVTGRSGGRALVEIVMREGRKREVRRMFAAVGHEVHRLVRTAIGPIRDQHLPSGEWRLLSFDEVRALYSAASGSWDDGGVPGREVT